MKYHDESVRRNTKTGISKSNKSHQNEVNRTVVNLKKSRKTNYKLVKPVRDIDGGRFPVYVCSGDGAIKHPTVSIYIKNNSAPARCIYCGTRYVCD